MKVQVIKKIYSFLVSFTVFGTLIAFDLPTPTRASFFQPDVVYKNKKWNATAAVRIGWGRTYDSFNQYEHKTSLFNARGPFDLIRLGVGLENLASKPATNLRWGPGGAFEDPDTLNLMTNDGKFEVGGRFKTTTLDLIAQLNLMWGFYAHLYVPFKDLKIDQISLKNLGALNVNGVPMTMFVTDELPVILQESGLKPLNTVFTKSGIGDTVLSLGWQGGVECQTGMIQSLLGYIQGGILVPLSTETDLSYVFSLPLGYNQHYGFVGRTAAEASLWGIVKFGIQFGSVMLLRTDENLRLKTDKNQNGWIILEKSRARFDPGTMWDVGAYLKFDQLVKGLAIIFGYSFTRQEKAILRVEDDNYLKTVRQNASPPNMVFIVQNAPNVVFVSQDDVANSDRRLDGWQSQDMHFVVRYDMSQVFKGGWGPVIGLEYSYPFASKYTWATSMFAGVLGFSATFNF